MNAPKILSELVKLDIKLWMDQDRLRYSAPKGGMSPELQQELVKHKAEIIAYLQNATQQSDLLSASIVLLPRPENIPLSFTQQRLWFLDQLTPGSAAYNMFSAVRFHGVLDSALLEQGFNQMVQRHESLRTIFDSVDGQPRQIVVPVLTVALPVVDLSALDQESWDAEVQRLAREEARQPFDLSRGPLLRCTLLRLDDNEHVLFLTMHHIISDGWSMGIFLRELVMLGQAYAAGQEASLAPLEIQYADFAVWQREWLQGEVLQSQMSYWKEQLEGAPTAIRLPTDRPRPAMQTYHGTRLRVALSRQLSDAVQKLGRQEDVTLFMTLLAGFQALLCRYSGQTDILVGSPIANRNRNELEGLIGFFANTLVMRTDLAGSPTCRELLRRVREVCLGAYDHQDMPFEKLVDELQVARNLSRNPLFQVMFMLQNAPLGNMEFSGLVMEPLEIEPDTAQFDLRLSLQETPAGLAGILEYNTDLFEQETIQLLFEAYRHILEVWVRNPEEALLEIRLPEALTARSMFFEELPAPKRKVDRKALLARDQKERERLSESAVPCSPVEQTLVDIWKDILKVEQVGIHDNFFELGGDSLLIMRVVARGHQAGLHFAPQDFFRYQTIAELASHGEVMTGPVEYDAVTGMLPLTIAQRWFFSQDFRYPSHWNVTRLVEVPAGTEPQILEQAVRYLWLHHDGLRTRFAQTETGWRQIIAPADQDGIVPFSRVDFSDLAPGQHTDALERAANEIQASLNIVDGPLMKVVFFNLGENRRGRLLIVLHHLIYDGVSRIFFEDFYTLSQQISLGEPAQLPMKTTPIWHWVERLEAYTRSPELAKEKDYWLSLPWEDVHTLPVDYPENLNDNVWGSVQSLQARLSLEETEVLLRKIPRAYGVQVIDVLITALAQTLTQWGNSRVSMFDVVDFGRSVIPDSDDLDLSRTVGWFSAHRRMVLQRADQSQADEQVKSIQTQLQNMPNRGLGYELLVYGSEDQDIVRKLQQLPRAEVALNYDGSQYGNTNLMVAYEYPGPASNLENRRSYLLDCSMQMVAGRLVSRWHYSKSIHKQSTIKNLAEDYVQWLRTLIAGYSSSK